MAENLIIIKRDGKPTNPPMAQEQANNYLKKLINADRYANLSQSLNQAFDGNGKPTGAFTYAQRPILHASSGNGETSLSLFYYMSGETITLVAMGMHVTMPKPKVWYKLSDYGQTSGTFSEGATIKLVG